MLTDVQINSLAERGGLRWWCFVAMAYAGLVLEYFPVVMTVRRYADLKNKAEGYDIAVEAWDRARHRLAGLEPEEVIQCKNL